jgi:hypothetical protein
MVNAEWDRRAEQILDEHRRQQYWYSLQVDYYELPPKNTIHNLKLVGYEELGAITMIVSKCKYRVPRCDIILNVHDKEFDIFDENAIITIGNFVYNFEFIRKTDDALFISVSKRIKFPVGIEDIDFAIMENMDGDTLRKVCDTNKYLRKICNNNDLWRRKLSNEVGKYPPDTLPQPIFPVLSRELVSYEILYYNMINNKIIEITKNKYQPLFQTLIRTRNKPVLHRLLMYMVQFEWLLIVKKTAFESIAETILKHVDYTDEEKGKLLVESAKYNSSLAILLLIKYGADIQYNDNEPLIATLHELHNRVSYDFLGGETLSWAVTRKAEDRMTIIKILLENGADIHARNDLLLLDAIQTRAYRVVKFLIEEGADIHAQNDKPVEIAVQKSTFSIVKILIEKGVDISNKKKHLLKLARKNSDKINRRGIINFLK